MIALDTNLLVYAQRSETPLHHQARALLAEPDRHGRPWAIPHHCLIECLGILTHRRIWQQPHTMAEATTSLESLLATGILVLHDGPESWRHLTRLAVAGRIEGPQVHDARIAACCLAHGVDALWSCDRDFSRFPGLTVINPLLGAD